MNRIAAGLAWLALYLAVAVAPLVFAVLGSARPSRGFLLDLSVALGFVGLAMLGLQFAVTARSRAVAAPYGIDVVLQFHRQISWVALAFVLAHPVLLVVHDRSALELLDLRDSGWQARFGVLAVLALLVLVGLTVLKTRLGLSYEVWRLSHGVLAVVVVAASLAHVGLVGYYVDTPWKRVLWIAMSLALVGLLVGVRVVAPLRQMRRPWEVTAVVPQRGDSVSVRLAPDGHDGTSFEAGQFAWLTVGGTPFRVREHPFSFSSSAERTGEVEFTVKALGDFTSQVPELAVGTRVYLDGPYGVFTTERNEAPGFVFVAGGVGITPVVSILRTLADRDDARPVLLVYASSRWEEVTFREELDELSARLDLEVVHVLDDPPDGWQGETGYVDAALLERHLPRDAHRRQHFVCGPQPMMAAVEEALVDHHGLPRERVVMEHFSFVE